MARYIWGGGPSGILWSLGVQVEASPTGKGLLGRPTPVGLGTVRDFTSDLPGSKVAASLGLWFFQSAKRPCACFERITNHELIVGCGSFVPAQARCVQFALPVVLF